MEAFQGKFHRHIRKPPQHGRSKRSGGSSMLMTKRRHNDLGLIIFCSPIAYGLLSASNNCQTFPQYGRFGMLANIVALRKILKRDFFSWWLICISCKHSSFEFCSQTPSLPSPHLLCDAGLSRIIRPKIFKLDIADHILAQHFILTSMPRTPIMLEL